MARGDRPAAVASLGKTVGVDDARGGLLPQEKHAEMARLADAGYRVGMVGDGINDGPALARAVLERLPASRIVSEGSIRWKDR